jgi:hypothetical protein
MHTHALTHARAKGSTYTRARAHTQKYTIPIAFHGKSDFVNAPKYYVSGILPVLLSQTYFQRKFNRVSFALQTFFVTANNTNTKLFAIEKQQCVLFSTVVDFKIYSNANTVSANLSVRHHFRMIKRYYGEFISTAAVKYSCVYM